jgi:hypothetical protein
MIMHPKLRRVLRSSLFAVTSIGLALVAPGLATTAARAQSLPPFTRFPNDAPVRLARAVAERLDTLRATISPALFSNVALDQLAQPEQRRSLWDSIEGALGSQSALATLGGAAPPSSAAQSTRAASLLDVLDDAIGAYMNELGHIALEIDRAGDRDAVSRLAPLHPGEQGTGIIEVGDVGAFHQLQVNFRGEIAHPDGKAPAVVAQFYLLPGSGGPPIPGRLVIPTAGAGPSFRADVATASGSETRDYGWRPRLSRMGSILELDIDGQWARVQDDLDLGPRQRRTRRDPVGFCDAACVGAER